MACRCHCHQAITRANVDLILCHLARPRCVMSLSLLEISVTVDSGKTRPLILNIKMLSYKCMNLHYENKKV